LASNGPVNIIATPSTALADGPLSNVQIIRTDAARFLADFLPDNSVECFHIYFPDPYPKKRHHKRRFFNPADLEQLLCYLIPTGTIGIATDDVVYFEQIQTVSMAQGRRLEKSNSFPQPVLSRANGLAQTSKGNTSKNKDRFTPPL